MIERRDNLIIGDSWDELEIDIPGHKTHSQTDVKLKNCPECKRIGKHNDFSLSVRPIDGVGHCFKCSSKFVIRKKKVVEKKEDFTPPDRKNLTKLSKAGLDYFINRRISQEAINHFQIVEGKNGYVAFPYFFNGKLVNVKYRNIYEKKFSQSPGGMHVMFNYDEAKKHKDVLIVEGEPDAMCWFDAGVPFATSVDAGAPNPNDRIEKKLACIDNCIDLFENAQVIYIGVDGDDNGKRLEQELIRRFQIEKVRIISYAPYKDANEFVMAEGRDKLRALLDSAKEIRMSGIFTANDVRARLMHMWAYGLPKATTTYYPSIDTIWKWRPTEVTLVSGFANDGKSTLFNVNLPVLKALNDGWKFGLFIPEQFPAEEFFEEVIHCYVGKTTDKDYPMSRMTEQQYTEAIDFIDKYFFTVFPEEKQTLDEIFERFDYLVRKHGINAIIIDPYNSVEHLVRPGETIDQYVTRFMGMLRRFAQKRNVCVILVAHQNPPEKLTNTGDLPEPNMYKVKNGGSFADRTDNLLTIHRPFRFSQPENPVVVVRSQKLKKKKLHMADTKRVEIDYHWQSNRYTDPLLGNRSPLDAPPQMASVDEHIDDDELPF